MRKLIKWLEDDVRMPVSHRELGENSVALIILWCFCIQSPAA